MRAPRRALLALPALPAARPGAAQPARPRLLLALDDATELPPPPALLALPGIEVIRAPTTEVQVAFARSVLAGEPSAELVVTSLRGHARGAAAGLWDDWPAGLLPPAATPLERAASQPRAGLVRAGVGGPFLGFLRARVPNPPRDARALLDFARQTRGFTYLAPDMAPGSEIFLAAVPLLLGEEHPAEPRRWTRAWTWLRELERHIPWRPASVAAALEAFQAGEVTLLPVAPAALRRFRAANPAITDAETVALPTPVFPLALLAAIPKGLPPARRALLRAATPALQAAVAGERADPPAVAQVARRPDAALLLEGQAMWARRILSG